jgi:nitrogen PTS system EIIA component
MTIAATIQLGTVVRDLKVANKHELLEDLARRAAPLGHLDREIVLRALLNREALGCTGIGLGVAIPHARFRSLKKTLALFAHLARPIDYRAVDGRPVDLVFLLIGPEPAPRRYLDNLVSVARALRDSTVRHALRTATDIEAVKSAFSTFEAYAQENR